MELVGYEDVEARSHEVLTLLIVHLEHLNISDVNFDTKEVMLFGKGNKHRVSYLNAKAVLFGNSNKTLDEEINDLNSNKLDNTTVDYCCNFSYSWSCKIWY